MKVTAVGTLKGGTGKTTVLFNMAGVLAQTSKVLVIDLDPQCNMSSSCGVNIARRERRSSKDIFDQNANFTPDELTIKAPIPELPNLDLIASHMLMTAVEFFVVNQAAREKILENYILDNKVFFEQYDYVLLDTNPSMGVINQNAFNVADSIVLVTDVGEDGIAGAELFCFLWENVRKSLRKPDNVKALVINQADRRLNLTKELREYCQEDEDLMPLLIGDMIYGKAIYKDARMANKPVCLLGSERSLSTKQRQAAIDATADVTNVVAALTERGVF